MPDAMRRHEFCNVFNGVKTMKRAEEKDVVTGNVLILPEGYGYNYNYCDFGRVSKDTPVTVTRFKNGIVVGTIPTGREIRSELNNFKLEE